MKHKSQARYPVSSAVVLRMFTDKAFHTKKLEQLGYKYRVLEHDAGGKEFRIRIERKVPMDAPGVVKKLFGAETTVVNDEAWNATAKTGRVKVAPQGVPVDISCTAAIKDEGTGCVVHYDWDITARVPLIGGAVEKFVVGDMDKRLAQETQAAIGLARDYAK